MISYLYTCVAVLLAFSLASLCPAIAATLDADTEPDQRGNRIETFEATSPVDPATGSLEVRCTADRMWCARIRADKQTGNPLLVLLDKAKPADAQEAGRYPMRAGKDDESLALWTRIVRIPYADGRPEQKALIGVVKHMRAMYSGGGSDSQRLSLIEVDTTFGAPIFKEVLSVPLSGSAMIRACFSENDMKARAGACHDEYSFSAELMLREAKTGELQFDYITTAMTYPGDVSRNVDSLAKAPLTEKDLIQVVNDECSYQRVVRFNPATERYEFDSPAPVCRDFTVL